MCAHRIFVGVIVAMVFCWASGCGKISPEAAGPVSEAVPVKVWKVEPGRITQRIEITGDVRPLSVVHLAAKVAGRLERLGTEDERGQFVPLSEGSYVKRGEPVAQIDLAVYEARFRQAQAALAVAEAQARDAEREAKRIRRLFKEGSVTEQMLDKAETSRDIAESALAQARAAFDLARIEFDEARLKSPVTGVVTRKHVDEGNLVSTGFPLLTIEDTTQVKIVASVAERYLPFLVEGQTRVEIRSDVLRGGALTSVVSKVYPAVDPVTRTVTVEILLDNAGGFLRSGNFVHVVLDLAEVDHAIVIPLSAVTWQGRDAFVFVADNGKALRRQVKVGVRELDKCQIVEGLDVGEALVIEGGRSLKAGDALRVEEVVAP